jgi:hypothetical protein
MAVAGDEERNVILMQARMPGRSAPLARLARQVGAAALEGFEDESFVNLDDPSQTLRLVGSGGVEKPMPAKRLRRKKERWLDHARAMIEGKSLAKTAELAASIRCGRGESALANLSDGLVHRRNHASPPPQFW